MRIELRDWGVVNAVWDARSPCVSVQSNGPSMGRVGSNVEQQSTYQVASQQRRLRGARTQCVVVGSWAFFPHFPPWFGRTGE